MSQAASVTHFARRAGGYLRDHWLGRHSLLRSFWINFALLRAVLYGLSEFTHPPFIADPILGAALGLAYIAVADLAIHAWQIVGVLRACDRHQADFGAPVTVYAAYFGIAVGLIFTLATIFTALQNSFILPQGESPIAVWERERAAQYSLSISENGGDVLLRGSFERGITKKLRRLLQRHPAVRSIILESEGGNLYEGRGVARLIRDRDLDSYAFGPCYSACATAFIAGRTRRLGPDGRLGFHQYRIDAGHQIPFADTAAEQAIDRAFYRSRRIASEFVARIFDAPHSEMWIPAPRALLEAGVVHEINARR